MAAALGVILFSVLASVGILPLPSKGAILVSSLVSVPVLALALHYAERKLSRLLDADWLE
jgi:hypothetical protein